MVCAFACLGLMASLMLAFSLAIDPIVLAAIGG
jgi:hypothetical protein